MSVLSKLFSFEGRIGRFDYWLYSIVILVLLIVSWVIAFETLGGPPEIVNGEKVLATQRNGGALMLAVIGPLLLFLWPTYALQVKRWHDRDKSAVWVLINFIPWLGGLWALIECGFLPGTRGGNRFGPGPGMSEERVAEIFDDVEDRAAAAIARYQAETQAQPAADRWSQPATPRSAAAPSGFGRRGLQPG